MSGIISHPERVPGDPLSRSGCSTARRRSPRGATRYTSNGGCSPRSTRRSSGAHTRPRTRCCASASGARCARSACAELHAGAGCRACRENAKKVGFGTPSSKERRAGFGTPSSKRRTEGRVEARGADVRNTCGRACGGVRVLLARACLYFNQFFYSPIILNRGSWLLKKRRGLLIPTKGVLYVARWGKNAIKLPHRL